MAETNLTKTGAFAKAQEIDFVNRFSDNVSKLMEALGVTRKLPVYEGTKIKTYKSTVTLADGKVAEGEIIPLSKVESKVDKEYELILKKYRKSVTGEAIQKHGFNQALIQADNKMLLEMSKGIRKDLFDFMATGTAKDTATGLQEALAKAWGIVETKFEDDAVQTICFVNPMDIATYIGNAAIVEQKIFGLTFLSGFTNAVVVSNTSVPVGKVYATAPENIVCAYIPVQGSELAKAFPMTSDETGYIGTFHEQQGQSLTLDTVALEGVLLFAERIDGVAVIDIKAPTTPEGK